jgi:hypothetical protein
MRMHVAHSDPHTPPPRLIQSTTSALVPRTLEPGPKVSPSHLWTQLVTSIMPLRILLLRHLRIASHSLYLQQVVEVLAVQEVHTYLQKCNGQHLNTVSSLHMCMRTHLGGTQSCTAPHTTPGTWASGSAHMHGRRSHPGTHPWGSPQNHQQMDDTQTTPLAYCQSPTTTLQTNC